MEDETEETDETDETDNAYARQWIWEPTTLPLQQSVTRAAPPLYNAGHEHGAQPWWNCDGVRFEPVADRPWNVVWMEPLAAEPISYSLRLHPQASGPEDGFGPNIAATVAGCNPPSARSRASSRFSRASVQPGRCSSAAS